MKAGLFSFVLLSLISSQVLAAQEPSPKDVTCVVEQVEMYQTKVEEVLSSKTIKPKFAKAERHGSDGEVLFKNNDIRIEAVLSYLKYTPLLTIYVNARGVSVDSGLETAVVNPKTGNTIVAKCTYVPGSFDETVSESDEK